jgi:hypothetical protein
VLLNIPVATGFSGKPIAARMTETLPHFPASAEGVCGEIRSGCGKRRAPEIHERFYAKRMNAHKTEIDASHVGFVTHPKEVVAAIEQAAQAR